MLPFSYISKEDLIHLGKLGFIVGPTETEEAFVKRVDKSQHFRSYPPKECDHFLTDSDWLIPLEKVRDLFGIKPDWVIGYYSNAKLSFYQGAATWILEKEEVRLPLIQLKKQLSKKSPYLRSDILAHELVHVARLQFDEPFFEEILAYRTSRNKLRWFFGPLFHKTWEVILFIFLFFVPLGSEIARFYFPDFFLWNLLFWLPWAYAIGLLIRLLLCQSLLSLAIWNLQRLRIAPEKELALLLHLTDREIFQIATCKKKIFKKNRSLRWRQIRAIFSFEKLKGF